MATFTHPKCGKKILNRGNKTGHCAKCCETFYGITAFDKHQRMNPDGSVTCLDPASLGFVLQSDDHWHFPNPDGVKWWEKDR